MRRIQRANEPRQLRLLLGAEPGRQWRSGGAPEAHEAIRVGLESVQDRCCAYCERPLSRDRERIEHVHPRSVAGPCASRPSANPHYDWNNLLLVCVGYATCDEAKGNKHLCADLLFPDEMDDDVVFFVDRLSGGLIVNPEAPGQIQIKARRSIDELRLNDPSLRESRLAVIDEFSRRLFNEGESIELICFEMRQEGFPTTVETMTSALG